MKKIIVILLCVSFISGCAANRAFAPTVYKHKDYGIGNQENPHFVQDRDECKKSVYANGVSSEGKQITNPDQIAALEKEFNDWMVKAALEAFNRSSGSYAYAGASAATAVTTGNTSNVSSNSKGIQMDPVPEKYQDLDKLRTAVGTCIANKGWIKQ